MIIYANIFALVNKMYYLYYVKRFINIKSDKMKTNTTIRARVESTNSRFGIIRHSSVRMFFNGILCAVTISDNPNYWSGNGMVYKYTYQIWDTYSMLTSSGDGMNDVLRINTDELLILSDIGNYRIRKVQPQDIKLYGVNNWKNVFIEPVNIITRDRISEVVNMMETKSEKAKGWYITQVYNFAIDQLGIACTDEEFTNWINNYQE
jgi:hypothetical protein